LKIKRKIAVITMTGESNINSNNEIIKSPKGLKKFLYMISTLKILNLNNIRF
jgi:hypothetical protein